MTTQAAVNPFKVQIHYRDGTSYNLSNVLQVEESEKTLVITRKDKILSGSSISGVAQGFIQRKITSPSVEVQLEDSIPMVELAGLVIKTKEELVMRKYHHSFKHYAYVSVEV